MLKSPKILEESEVSIMRNFHDTDCVYYYLEKSGRKMYDDWIVKPRKDYTIEDGSFDAGVLSTDVRAYFDELFGKFMVDNQVHENRFLSHIKIMV